MQLWKMHRNESKFKKAPCTGVENKFMFKREIKTRRQLEYGRRKILKTSFQIQIWK